MDSLYMQKSVTYYSIPLKNGADWPLFHICESLTGIAKGTRNQRSDRHRFRLKLQMFIETTM